jgi:hypothetical protein
MAEKNKYSDYDLKSLLLRLTERVAMTTSREWEGGFGETDFSVAGDTESFKRVSEVTDKILKKIREGELPQVLIDSMLEDLFPKVNIEKLTTAIKQGKLSFQCYDDLLICITIENTLPEYIEYFAKSAKLK